MKARKPVIMLIDDAPIPEVAMARAQEHHERTSTFGRLCNEGHVKVLLDCDPVSVRCEIEGEIFTEARDQFPSTVLMARLQLAIAAGQSCKNRPPELDHAVDAMRYAWSHAYRGMTHDAVWLDEAHGYDAFEHVQRSEVIAQGYSNVSKITKKITAAVKARRGGLRP
jgi:hypothetical protein